VRTKKTVVAAVTAALAGVALMPWASQAATGTTSTVGGAVVRSKTPSDDMPNPLADRQSALRQTALQAVLNGTVQPQNINGSTVVRLRGASGSGTPDYVELQRQKTDNIFVILAQFGNKRDPRFPDKDTDPDTAGPTTWDGPMHNQIPRPDRSENNYLIWQRDYNRQHFQNLYFGSGTDSVKSYYERQSSGRYSVNGRVVGWVKVPYNEARYGRSGDFSNSDPNVCADIICDNTWALIRDAVNQWVRGQRANGKTDQQIAKSLAQFDQWDRYDYDGDGNFNEPDGYIDHFQIVHAGGDEADGDPIYGEDAIWSHRWYAYLNDAGVTGPAANPLGGTPIGKTGLWVGDYTIQPENGGLGVFVHEYGHDLGLPDEYDTSYAGEAPSGFWTLMSQGSNLDGAGGGLGSRPDDFNAWDKLQLGWLDYAQTRAGQNRTLTLGPAEYNTAHPQALITVLPKKKVVDSYGGPYAGSKMWWSTRGDNLNTTMTRTVDLTGASSAQLTMQAKYDIETDYDYAYAEISTNGGTSWTALDGTADGAPIGTDGSRPALTGSSGDQWVPLSYPLDAYAGQQVLLRVRYTTDGGVAPYGLFADDVTVSANGHPLFVSGAENGDEGWTLDGFKASTGTENNSYFNAYIAENRINLSYDTSLQGGPYNFGFLDSKPNYVEHFPYGQGLLVSYWDESQVDNNTGEHPGSGLILPIDSHPYPRAWRDGTIMRTRIQVADAPFSLAPTTKFRLHRYSEPTTVWSKRAVPVFNDLRKYWFASKPDAGVQVPHTGTSLRVVSVDGHTVVVKLRPVRHT